MDQQATMNNGYYAAPNQTQYYGAPQQYPYQPYGYAAPQQQPVYPSVGMGYIPQVPNPNLKVPSFNNALTSEEISVLRSANPSGQLDVNVSNEDALRGICNHKNGTTWAICADANDPTEAWCTICQKHWNTDIKPKEEVAEHVKAVIDSMQNCKACGDLPIGMTREYFTIIPMLEKWPDLYEVGMANWKKMNGDQATFNANDYSVYACYNALTSGGYVPNPYMGQPVYQQPYGAPQQPVYQQPFVAPQPQQPAGYYYQQQPAQPANPYANPMQAPVGFNPQAPNQQFVQQAQNMMPQQPIYGTPQPQAPVQAPAQPQAYQPAAVQQPAAAPAAPEQKATTEVKVEI